MLGKVKNWGTKKLLEKQLKDVPEEQQKMIMTLFEKDPKLLEQISKEMKAAEKSGLTQMQASMKVMPKYQAKLQALMGGQVQRPMGGAKGFNPNGSLRK